MAEIGSEISTAPIVETKAEEATTEKNGWLTQIKKFFHHASNLDQGTAAAAYDRSGMGQVAERMVSNATTPPPETTSSVITSETSPTTSSS